MLDKCQNADALMATSDPISGYTNMSHDYHEQSNGAWELCLYVPNGCGIEQIEGGKVFLQLSF
jgi:hypothetical protein